MTVKRMKKFVKGVALNTMNLSKKIGLVVINLVVGGGIIIIVPDILRNQGKIPNLYAYIVKVSLILTPCSSFVTINSPPASSTLSNHEHVPFKNISLNSRSCPTHLLLTCLEKSSQTQIRVAWLLVKVCV